MLTDTQKETLTLFKAGADKLEKLVSGLSEAELNKSVAPGEWSIRQVVHHVAEDGDAWSLVVKQALAVSGNPLKLPEFPGNEPWADALGFDKRPINTSLTLLKAHRAVIAELATDFPEAWNNYVAYPDAQGKMTQSINVGRIIQMLTDHMAEHIATIESIKRQHGI
jgi:hypothetical protein